MFLEHQSTLEGWGASTGLSTMCYQKSRDGGDAYTYHSLCDPMGAPQLMIMKLGDNRVIGGYTLTGSSSGYSGCDSSAFLFSVSMNYKHTSSGAYYSCSNSYYNYSSYGPTFGGGHDLYVDVRAPRVGVPRVRA